MATTAPGSPYVESSDLVANYPAVSEALAERVDTVGVLPFATSTARGTAIPSPTEGQYTYLQDTNATEYWDGSAWVAAGVAPGLVHINTTTFSAVSSVSVDDCFTSEYDNYRAVYTCSADGNRTINFRYRVSGADNSTANYDSQYLYAASTTVGASRTTGITNGVIGFASTPGPSGGVIDFMSPQLAANKTALVYANYKYSSGLDLTKYANFFSATTQFDGFSLIASVGTITGTIRIYGYKNS